MKNVISIALSLVLCLSMFTGISFSDSSDDYNETVLYQGRAIFSTWDDEEVACQVANVPGAAAGGKLVITATPTGASSQVLIAAKVGETWTWTTVVYSAELVNGKTIITLTADQAALLANAKEIDFKGNAVTVTKIAYVSPNAIDTDADIEIDPGTTVLYQGCVIFSTWDDVVACQVANVPGAVAGGKLVITATPTGEEAQIQIATKSGDDWRWTTVIDTLDIPSSGIAEVILTADQAALLASANNKEIDFWGNAITVTKIVYVSPDGIDTDTEINQDTTGSLKVSGTKLLDGNGNSVMLRGVNVPYLWYTSGSMTAINALGNLGANCVRVVLGDGARYSKISALYIENIINACKAQNMICVLEVHDHTGSDSTDALTETATNYWIEIKDLLNANTDYVIVNIANEWMGSWNLGTTWANAYKTSIQSLRNAGIKNVIMVDAPGWGQDVSTMSQNCQSVLSADTTGNTMFSIHMYGATGGSAALVKNNINNMISKGVCFCVGEFGDYQGGTDVDEDTIMSYCQEKGIGWIAWSWKGNSGGDENLDMADDWAGNSLTTWGEKVINGTYGIKNTSVKVTDTDSEIENSIVIYDGAAVTSTTWSAVQIAELPEGFTPTEGGTLIVTFSKGGNCKLAGNTPSTPGTWKEIFSQYYGSSGTLEASSGANKYTLSAQDASDLASSAELWITGDGVSVTKVVYNTTGEIETDTDTETAIDTETETDFETDILQQFFIMATSSNNNYGSVSGGGMVTEGESVTIRAIPKSGYKFKRWVVNNSTFSTNAQYTFVPTTNLYLVAEFSIDWSIYPVSSNRTFVLTVEEDDVTGVWIDIGELYPILFNPDSWAQGVEVDFTYSIPDIPMSEQYGNRCGGNGALIIKYGETYTWKDKNIWAYDVNWMADKGMTCNTAKLEFDTAGAPIMEAGFRLFNFQQAADGDLDDYIIGNEVLVSILDIRVGGQSIFTSEDTDSDTDSEIENSIVIYDGAAVTSANWNGEQIAELPSGFSPVEGGVLYVTYSGEGQCKLAANIPDWNEIFSQYYTDGLLNVSLGTKKYTLSAQDASALASSAELWITGNGVGVTKVVYSTTGEIDTETDSDTEIEPFEEVVIYDGTAVTSTTWDAVQIVELPSGFSPKQGGYLIVTFSQGGQCKLACSNPAWKQILTQYFSGETLDVTAGTYVYQLSSSDASALASSSELWITGDGVSVTKVVYNTTGEIDTDTEIDTETDTDSNDADEIVIYDGEPIEVNWDCGAVIAEFYKDPGFEAGGMLKITFERGKNAMFKLATMVGDEYIWTEIFFDYFDEYDIIEATADEMTFVLSAVDAEAFVNVKELYICGNDITVTKVVYSSNGKFNTDTDTDTDTDSDIIQGNPITLTRMIEEGDVTGVSIDLIEMFPQLANASAWAQGVQLDFTYEIPSIPMSEEWGNGCGGNGALYIRYGENYRFKDKNIWAYDKVWAEYKGIAYNTAKLTFDTEGGEIKEAGFRVYNFQQAKDNDLDAYIVGKPIIIKILDVRVGGQTIMPNTDTDTDSDSDSDSDSETDSEFDPNAPYFEVESKTAKVGDTVTVNVKTNNNPGIVSCKLSIGYDANALELTGIQGAEFESTSFGPLTSNPVIVNWVDAINPNNTTNGILATLTFKVKDDAELGETNITLSYDEDDVYNSDFDNVEFGIKNGTINILSYTPGDVSDDGAINNKDLGLLQRYLNGWDVQINLDAADVNRDGKVNNKDYGILQRYLNDWDVTLM